MPVKERKISWANDILIAVNVLVFAAGLAAGRLGPGTDWFYHRGALYAPLLLKGQGFYRLLTAVFLHWDAAHLVNNMIVQFAGGEIVERNLGHIRYAVLYILCGVGGNLASVLMDFLTGEYGFSAGASGAVFGVIGALLYMILRERSSRRDVSGQSRGDSRGDSPGMKSLMVRAGLMTAYLLYSGWQNPVVNQSAHVGGLICGFVLAAALMPRGRGDLGELLREL